MVELSGFKAKLHEFNVRYHITMTFYLYWDAIYSIIYDIMESYKNYLNCSKTVTHNWFNKVISSLWIKVEHGFAINQNL